MFWYEKIIGYSDSDFAGDLDRRRSLTVKNFTLLDCTFSWKATLQSIVDLSTTEAKYMAVTGTVKEVIWLGDLIEDLSLH